jgi:hypothetical protein
LARFNELLTLMPLKFVKARRSRGIWLMVFNPFCGH